MTELERQRRDEELRAERLSYAVDRLSRTTPAEYVREHPESTLNDNGGLRAEGN